jgi:hypothetical protein
MKSLNTIACLVLLATFRVSLGDALPLEAGAVRCDPSVDEARRCDIRWDLSATPRSAYAVQWLSPDTGRWEPVFKRRFWSPHEMAGPVSTGKLYRVLGCDDRRMEQNCVSTTVFWAPVITDVDQIPDSVSVTAPDGTTEIAAISRDGDTYTRLMQFNVYMLANLLGRAPDAILPPMNAPAEPGVPGDLAHDVHHNVHTTYESARSDRMLRLPER